MVRALLGLENVLIVPTIFKISKFVTLLLRLDISIHSSLFNNNVRTKDEDSCFDCQCLAPLRRAIGVFDGARRVQIDMQRDPHGSSGRERSLHACHEASSHTQPLQCVR